MEEQELSGVLLLDKSAGCTSHDVVNRVRRLFGTRRVGHTGTLDPMATGLLVVLVGRAAKAAEYLTSKSKEYVATLKLGVVSDTEDVTGTLEATGAPIPTVEEVEAILPRFRGEILQTPPMYSALKVGGRKLVDLARKGETIEREARKITIYSLSVEPTDVNTDYKMTVACSGGTYIRTLCADIGNALGCGGAMASLRRTAVDEFSLSDAHTPEELEAMSRDERTRLLLPVEHLFAACPAIRLSPFYERLCRSGCKILTKKLGAEAATLQPATRVRLCSEKGDFFALGEIESIDDGPVLKAIKTFVL